MSNKPLAYERGWAEFYKLRFKITPDVLIPRPETELLVDEVIKLYPKTVVDVGTGSGCIAISVAKNLPNVKVIGVDISEKALSIARQNSKLNRVEKNVVFVQNDLMTGFQNAPDVIVANLPYIPSSRIPKLEESVKNFEPIVALDGGYDGFEVYRKLFEQIKRQNLTPKVLICEIDDAQADIARYEAKKFLPAAKIEIKKDLSERSRILIIS